MNEIDFLRIAEMDLNCLKIEALKNSNKGFLNFGIIKKLRNHLKFQLLIFEEKIGTGILNTVVGLYSEASFKSLLFKATIDSRLICFI